MFAAPASVRRDPEPAWHRRERAKRSQARILAKLGAACQLLSQHHGSAAPESLHFLVRQLAKRKSSSVTQQTGQEDVACGSCGMDNWCSRSWCRHCDACLVPSVSTLNAEAAAYFPSQTAQVPCTADDGRALALQFANFASSTVTSLASIWASVSAVRVTLADLDAALAKRPQTQEVGGSVSLQFVNDLVDSLDIAGVDVVKTQPSPHSPAVEPAATATDILVAESPLQPTDAPLAIGVVVWITGLVGNADLNGSQATVLELADSSGRVAVLVPGSALFGREDRRMKVKRANLKESLWSSMT
jgi:hypothetical protein